MSDVPTPRSSQKIRFDRCIFCQKVSDKAIVTSKRETVVALLETDRHDQVAASGRDTFFYHKACYASRRKRQVTALLAENPSCSTSPKRTRSLVDLKFDNSLCVFCQSKKKSGGTDTKGSLICFATNKGQLTVESCLLACEDATIKWRLHQVDLVANEVKYHKSCYTKFRANCGMRVKYNSKDVYGKLFNEIDMTYNHFKPEFEQHRAVSVDVLADFYNQNAEEHRETKSILRSFMAQYSNHVRLIDLGTKEKFLVINNDSMIDMINHVKASDSSTNLSKDEIIENAAAAIVSDIKAKWHPVESFNMTTDTVASLIPKSLSLFLDKISRSGELSQKSAIAMDIIAMCVRRVPPTHITLASSVKHLTGSRTLIDQLNKMGHCCSYTELLRFETSAAVTEIAYAQENGVVIPPIIQEAENGFLQAAADNDDFLEETIDGKNTTHGTTMVLFQHTGQYSPTFNRPLCKTRRRSLDSDELKSLLKIKAIDMSKKTSFPGLAETRALRQLSNTDYVTMPELDQAKIMDMEWILCRLAPTIIAELDIQPSSQECPSWSSWNARKTRESPELKAVVGYCPMLNAKSDDPSTVYTILLQLKKMMGILKQKHSVITFDLAIYRVAKEVVWARPTEFQHTIIRLGGFHIITNYFGALGNMLQTCGVVGLLTESGLYSEATTRQILSGSHYNRGVRAHKLLLETLLRQKLFALQKWMAGQQDEGWPIELSEDQPEQMAVYVVQKLNELDAAASDNAYLYRFWNQYIAAVQAVLGLIRSERIGNWQLYLESITAMLPTFYTYDRIHYSRWLPIYLSDMLNLEDTAIEVHQEFLQGKFSINRSGNPFAAIPTDQTLEQTLNKDSKMPGGLTGISIDEEARTKWFLTSHVRAQMYAVQNAMCDLKISKQMKHREDVLVTTMKDEADVQALLATIEKSGVDIFCLEETALIDIISGVSPAESTAKQIVNAFNQGVTRLKEFVQTRLGEKQVPFDATLSKQKVPPFTVLKKPETTTRGKKAKKKVSFAKLLIIGQSRDIDIKEILQHETGEIPLALFDEKGNQRKSTKSQAVKILEEKYLHGNYPVENPPSKKALIIDGMVIVQTMKGVGTFGEYSHKIFDNILSLGNGYDRVDVVFDVYQSDSIKSKERERRGAQKMFTMKILHADSTIPKRWNDFLSNIQNKNELVAFFQRSWGTSMADKVPPDMVFIVSGKEVSTVGENNDDFSHLLSNHDEADTRLLLHAADALLSCDVAVIRSVDTDVLILGIHHYSSIVKDSNKDIVMWLGMGENKRHVSIQKLIESMPERLTKNILSSYALTGCDATSGLYRITKRRAFSVLENGDFDLTALGEKNAPLNEDISRECERYLAALYGEYCNLTEARYHLIATKNVSNESQLPPSANAAKYHIRRAAYQVLLWKQSLTATLADLPSPTDFGWDTSMAPIRCDLSPIHSELAVACGCKKSKCKGQSCRCYKQNVSCTDACGCQDCMNISWADEDEDDIDDEEREESE